MVYMQIVTSFVNHSQMFLFAIGRKPNHCQFVYFSQKHTTILWFCQSATKFFDEINTYVFLQN